MDEKLLIGSLAVLAVFVLWLVFLFGRMIFSGIREEKRRRETKRDYQSEKFGLLTSEMDVWSGKTNINGLEVPFSIGGSEESPDPKLLDRLESILSRFQQVHKIALDYLLKENPSSVPLEFSFLDIDILYPEDPDHFTFSFALKGDEEGIWRVEFENDSPVFTGRDD
ncbi:MAG: hypothetical protein ACO1QB_02030 [Verrucomicrobiales bacterium]